MTTLAFSIPGEPRGKGRPRIVKIAGFSRMATDAKTASYENLVALAAQQALGGREPLDGALAISVAIKLTPAASASRKGRAAMLSGEQRPTKKPDLDNVVKAVLDGCNAVAFRDDALIVELAARKLYAETAGVDVVISRVAPTPVF
jgi:Holliday junction resolvase RusA-like endonuclease